jgi:hypothetical protein
MIDGGLPSGRDTWPADVLERLLRWEQGDVVAAPPFFYFADPSKPVWAATVAAAEMTSDPHVIVLDEETSPPYGLITTQSCDICEEDSRKPHRPWVQVAPIYDGRSWAKKMKEGRGPLFLLHIPGLGDDRFWVADLRLEFPIEKGWLAGQERVSGFTTDVGRREVRQRLGWLRTRPAFSRVFVAELCRPLGEHVDMLLKTKSRGIAREVREILVRVDNEARPTTAELCVITVEAASNELKASFNDWRDTIREPLTAGNINLLAIRFSRLEDVNAAEYRQMIELWRPSTGGEATD